MPNNLSRHPNVREDLIVIADFISRDNPPAAEKLMDAIVATLELLRTTPLAGVKYPTRIKTLENIRMFPVSGFRNFLIFYIPFEDELRILYIYHRARNILKEMRQDSRS